MASHRVFRRGVYLYFVVNTSDIALVKQCQEQFNFTLLSVALERRRTKFMHKLCCVDLFT